MIEKICSRTDLKNHVLIFDLDGTLVNTDLVNFLAYKQAIQIVSDIDLKTLHDKNKRFTRKNLFSIIDNLSIQEYERIIELKTDLYHKYLCKSKVNNSLLRLINFNSRDNQIVLATSSHKGRAEMVLRYHDLINIFDYRFYKEDYKNNNKFQHVLFCLNIRPSLAMVFENNEDEIEKASLSGIPDKNIINLSKESCYE